MAPKVDIAEKIKFIDLCNILEKIQKADGVQSKEKHLRRYIESFNEFRKKFIEENGNDCESSFYCILRCLLPNADNARPSYNIRITTMGNLYVKILNLSPNSDDAQKLQYKAAINGSKDYSDIVYSVMQRRANDQPSQLTLAGVHSLLDVVAESDRKRVECELTKFIQTTSAMEQKWLIRIILKRMHLGIGEQKVFSIYHPQAKELYVRHSNLYKLCMSVEKGESFETDGETKPFQHIRPMLCGRIDITQLENMLKTGTFYLETKMDGERFHLHVVDEEFRYISRNGKDYTKNYGSNTSEGNLTPLIAKLFNIKIKNIVLDGEMMVWNKSTASYHVKGENIDVKHLPAGGNLRPCLVPFDLLYLNDKSYLDIPYVERIATLHKILKEQTGVLSYCKRIKIQNTDHFKNLFNEALKNDEEGVVLKSQVSLYKPGSRTGGWYKVKPDYIEGITSDFDLLIIGGFYNRPKTYIDSYVVGVCKKSSDDDEMPTFYSVGTVSSGLNLQERKLLNDMLSAHWKNDGNPSNIEWGVTVPDVWINPKDSVILQIRASELFPNSNFRTPYALRFPRIDVVRRDKIWSDCMTLEEFEAFYKGNTGVKKITKRGLNTEDLVANKKLKGKGDFINPYAVKFQPEKVQKVSNEFSGFSICILSTSKDSEFSLDELKEIVTKHGGKIVENPLLDSKNCFCVAGDMTISVKRIKDTGLYNIVSIDWLIRAFKEDAVRADAMRPKPRDMICCTPDMKEELEKFFDQYGDSYADHVGIEEMKTLLQELDSQNLKPLLDSEIKDLEQELYNGASPNFYRTISGYFYSSTGNLSRLSTLAKLIFEAKGGQSVDYCQTEQKRLISFIFVDTVTANMLQLKLWLDANFAKRMNVIKVVSCDWIFKCDQKNEMIDVNNFLIKF